MVTTYSILAPLAICKKYTPPPVKLSVSIQENPISRAM